MLKKKRFTAKPQKREEDQATFFCRLSVLSRPLRLAVSRFFNLE
jgi:hypothetical protein